jgi:hypothetical protein
MRCELPAEDLQHTKAAPGRSDNLGPPAAPKRWEFPTASRYHTRLHVKECNSDQSSDGTLKAKMLTMSAFPPLHRAVEFRSPMRWYGTECGAREL